MSVDGYLDDASDRRLVLSDEADLDRVDAVRAGCDAILVGAETIRRDNPRLVIRDERRRAARVRRGAPPDPIKVTLTRTGRLDRTGAFFATGTAPRLVYTPADRAAAVAAALGDAATVIPVDGLDDLLADLPERGVRRLMVEGGGRVLDQFLRAGRADELQVMVAPFLVGDPRAARLSGDGDGDGEATVADDRPDAVAGSRAGDPRPTMRLAGVDRIGDGALLRYVLSPAGHDHYWLEAAVAESRRCPPSPTAYSVGAVVVGPDGREISRGYSREGDPLAHAEEVALTKLDGTVPAGATIYSSLEPCSVRRSRSRSCAGLIRASGIRRVVYARREPDVFVDGTGDEELRAAGLDVVRLDDLGYAVDEVNAHLLG